MRRRGPPGTSPPQQLAADTGGDFARDLPHCVPGEQHRAAPDGTCFNVFSCSKQGDLQVSGEATTVPRSEATIVRSELVGSPFQTSGSWLRWAPPWRRRGGASVEWVRRPLPQSDFFYEHVLAAHGLPPLLGTPSWGRPRPGFGGDDSLFRRLTCPMTYPSHRGEKVSHPRRLRPDVVCAAPRAPGIAPRRGDPRRPGAHPRAEGVPYHPGPGPDPRRLRELPPPARLDARHAHAVAGRPQQGPAKILRCSAYRARLSSRGD